MTAQLNATPSAEEIELFDNAHHAAKIYRTFSKKRVEQIVNAVAAAAIEKSEFYAEWAVRETGFGDVGSKMLKHKNTLMCIEDGAGAYIDPKIDHEKKIISFPKPAGVIIGLIPSTNPVSTVIYKVFCTLLSRNAIILCPHPGAKDCSNHIADYLEKTAVTAGAPKGLIQSLQQPSVPLVNKLMKSDRTSLILATGGPAMVRAAYSSSNPAIGVGPGNVACYVHETADISKTAERISSSAGFDNSLPCTTESVVIADRVIATRLLGEMAEHAAYHIVDADDISKVRAFLFPEGKMNPKAIGKSAEWISEKSGIQIPVGTKLLIIEIFTIGYDEPISKEKMFPLLGFLKIDGGVKAGIRSALAMLDMQGKGHSAVVHAKDPDVIARYGNALPVCRISVNSRGVTGSSGFDTNLIPGAVIGTGFFGRSSVYENVGPKHLIQWTNVAYNKDPSEVMGDIGSAMATLMEEMENNQVTDGGPENPLNRHGDIDELRAMIKEMVTEELRQILKSGSSV
ncbi:MAG: aldehyde dehydrogenase family protein [Deltaproteobacteria bacterium]|nr:aldehyde dehydrogenase family protein [Deltaproteobacteria bacterium]MBT4642636.1 aldehyde dehydrogenase family protein [Deltaproteobacteria bacterium]MBT6501299.1 aldehyde dehydrogenase family protein [Deltaproteobacteria bacterium]MBT7891668.1 aldehyde dehydrogenase family protein [Deltaproteobacteria bacterium]